MRLVLLALVSTSFLFAACGHDDDHDAYATFQACFDDHSNVESLPHDQSIVICCIEHPLGSTAANTACGADSAACVTYVTANLTSTSATAAEIMAGCTTYQSQH
jgi:hypothetical protein